MVAGSSPARKPLLALLALVSSVLLAACAAPTGMGGPTINTRAAVQVALLAPQIRARGRGPVAEPRERRAPRHGRSRRRADRPAGLRRRRVADRGRQCRHRRGAGRRADHPRPGLRRPGRRGGRAVAPRNINVLSFSNNTSVAGGNLFVLGNTFENTANRLVRYAVRQRARHHSRRPCRGPLRTQGRDAVLRPIQASGASVAGVTGFELSQQGVINAVPGDLGPGAGLGRGRAVADLGDHRRDPLPRRAPARERRRSGAGPVHRPAAARHSRKRADALGPPGRLVRGPRSGPYGAVRRPLPGAYGAAPHPIAGLAYDAIAAIGALVSQGQSDALTGQALTQPSGFVGVNGVFRLLPDGTNERGLAVAQIQNNRVIVIDPAPRSFAGAGL
jgi:hypothetical protein